MRFVHFADDATVFTSADKVDNVHDTVDATGMTMFMPLTSGSRPTDFLSTSVKLHINYDNLPSEKCI